MTPREFDEEFRKAVHELIEPNMPPADFFFKWPTMIQAMHTIAIFNHGRGITAEEAAKKWYDECIAPRFLPDWEELEIDVPGYGTRIRIWEKAGFRLELFDSHNETPSRYLVAYRLLDDGKEIFGKPHHVSVCKGESMDGHPVVINVLTFCTVKREDTDPEYFESYSKEQLAWTESDGCENLSFIRIELDEMFDEACRANPSNRVNEVSKEHPPEWACGGWDGEDEHDLLTCPVCYENWTRLREGD